MGAEATCTVRLGGRTAEGKARLETDVLQFRGGDIRLSIDARYSAIHTAEKFVIPLARRARKP